jgi:hypothetical protein
MRVALLAVALAVTALPGFAEPGISAGDVLGQVSAEVPFVRQHGWNLGTDGNYYWPNKNAIPETGIRGSPLSGDPLRFGKVADPLNPARRALQFQLGPKDALVSGSQRTEIEMDQNIEMEKVYWVAFELNVQDWGVLAKGDDANLMQLHAGNSDLGLSPQIGLTTAVKKADARGNWGREFEVWVLYSTEAVPDKRRVNIVPFNIGAIPFGRWSSYVFKFRQSLANGMLQVWVDGRQVVNYRGPLGFNPTPGFKDYVKFGYYNWTRPRTSRKLLMRSMVVVADSANKYGPEALSAFARE